MEDIVKLGSQTEVEEEGDAETADAGKAQGNSQAKWGVICFPLDVGLNGILEHMDSHLTLIAAIVHDRGWLLQLHAFDCKMSHLDHRHYY